MNIYIIVMLVMGVVLIFSEVVMGKYMAHKERKSAANLQRLLNQAKIRLGENHVYSKRR